MLSVIDFIFFFKQKTAYELRISYWSSDVCSSYLRRANAVVEGADKESAADGVDDQAGEQVAAISTEHGKTSCRSYGSRAFPRAGPAGDSCGKGWEARRVGKECVSTGEARWLASRYKTT